MGVLTNLLKLLKPGENDYYNQQTEQADNWDKVDNYAVLTNTDKNGIWGGEYGGKIQDPIPKELNKRYIDNINGKAFICIKAGDSSVTSNTTEYFTPCNVVDNLGKLQNLVRVDYKKVTLTKTETNSTEYHIYEGLYSLDIAEGYRLISIITIDSGAVLTEGVNYSIESNRGYAFGFRVKSSSAPQTIEYTLQIILIKSL